MRDTVTPQAAPIIDSATPEALRHAIDRVATLRARVIRVGKHVRLVSLNASVEAARAGDVGKGLMVIAHEFKSLAEEIQSLAKDARGDMGQFP